jgi:hypothetical protein
MAMASVEKPGNSRLAQVAALGVAGAGAVWAGLWRLVPHWPNFTPVGGLALFAGARLRLWQAFALPLAVMAASDLLLWAAFGKAAFDPWVYASFALNVLLGRWLLRKGRAWRIPVVSLIASLQFFVLSNFGTWAGGTIYPRTLAGLGACFAAALPFAGDWRTDGTPFFFGTVAGDLACSALFFGLYAVIVAVAGRQKASQPI